MKKAVKIICCIMLMLLLLSHTIYATTNPLADPDHYKPSTVSQTTEVVKMGKVVIGTLRTVGVVVSVVVIMILGLKYMMGSAAERADYKKTMGPYLVGVILLFASTGVIDIIYQLVSSI